ncbi:ChrR family anti-sigma-E factor [Caulobacter sp. KR2-114]|uniref:ChrR family anti-sigma-E factor n=1 Tax=Caulobacter sp. KR2-114 TaxID=3400912 RepID=UPI003C0AE566
MAVSTRHHPADASLVAYAAGTIEPGRALVLAAHIAACPDCRRTLGLAEAVGGALLSGLEPTPMAPGAREALMARLDDPEPAPAPHSPPQRPDWIAVPAQVLEAARRRKRWAAPGVWVASIAKGPGRRSSYLLRVGAGMAMPRHTHTGVETILVLKGAYEDRGQVYGPGDLAENDETVDHRPQVTAEGECVCLVFADAPLRPLDWVGRLFQPFVGI